MLSGSASAETLYKCVAKNGAVSYQSFSCEPGQHVARAREYVPESRPSYEDEAARQRKRERDSAESAYLSRLAGTTRANSRPGGGQASIQMPQNSSACSSARASRQAALERAGLNRTYDLLSKLDE